MNNQPKIIRNAVRGYDVRLDGILIGRVRQTDGEWNASYWHRCPPSFMAREMVNLGGTWRRRREAVAGVVSAWLTDNQ